MDGLQWPSFQTGDYSNLFGNYGGGSASNYVNTSMNLANAGGGMQAGGALGNQMGMDSLSAMAGTQGGGDSGMGGIGSMLGGMVGYKPGNGPMTGAMQGAMTGTQMSPGWGTLIGAAVGALAGALSPDLPQAGASTQTTFQDQPFVNPGADKLKDMSAGGMAQLNNPPAPVVPMPSLFNAPNQPNNSPYPNKLW